jgi:hypothetical protein
MSCAGFPVVNFFVSFVGFYVWCKKTLFFLFLVDFGEKRAVF